MIRSINYFTIPAICTIIINSIIIFIVLSKKVDIHLKINFSLYLLGISIYSLLEVLSQNSKSLEFITLTIKLMVPTMMFTSIPFMMILIYLINRKIKSYYYLLYSGISITIIQILLLDSNLIIESIHPIYYGFYGKWGIFTKIMGYYSIIFHFAVIIASYYAYLKNKNDQYLKKSYLFFLITITGIMTGFIILVILQAILENYNLGIAFFTTLLSLSGIAIFFIIYFFRFFNINIFFRIQYLIFPFLFMIFLSILYITNKSSDMLIISAIAFVITLLIYIILNLFFKNKFTNIILLKQQILLKEFLRFLPIYLKEDSFSSKIKLLRNYLYLTFSSDLLFFGKKFKKKKNIYHEKSREIKISEKIENFFLKENIIELNPFLEYEHIKLISEDNYNILKKNRIRLIFPFFHHKKNYGFFAITDKNNDKIFTYSEIMHLNFIFLLISLSLESLINFKKDKEKESRRIKNKIYSLILHDLKNLTNPLLMAVRNIENNFEKEQFLYSLCDLFSTSLNKIENIEKKINNFNFDSSSLIKPMTLIEEIIKTRYKKRKIEYKFKYKDISIQFSEDEFRQLIVNLIDNALESSYSKNIVVKINDSLINNNLIITIKDNGDGIPPAYLKNFLFKPFHSTKENGMGLGLFNCKEIMNKNNGNIHIKSAVKKGTIVKLKFNILP